MSYRNEFHNYYIAQSAEDKNLLSSADIDNIRSCTNFKKSLDNYILDFHFIDTDESEICFEINNIIDKDIKINAFLNQESDFEIYKVFFESEIVIIKFIFYYFNEQNIKLLTDTKSLYEKYSDDKIIQFYKFNCNSEKIKNALNIDLLSTNELEHTEIFKSFKILESLIRGTNFSLYEPDLKFLYYYSLMRCYQQMSDYFQLKKKTNSNNFSIL